MDEMITPQAIRSAAIVVSALPIMMVYPFLQRYFVKGVMLGSLKG
jgi:putative aldouronate transport system permease protein